MEMKGTEGEFITMKAAMEKQDKHLNFRKQKLKETDPPRSQFFGKEKILALLSKPECVGIKIIFGNDEKDTPSLVLVAADSKLKVLAKDNSGLKGGDDNSYLANGPGCPNLCQ
jgi:hypothetical protein